MQFQFFFVETSRLNLLRCEKFLPSHLSFWSYTVSNFIGWQMCLIYSHLTCSLFLDKFFHAECRKSWQVRHKYQKNLFNRKTLFRMIIAIFPSVQCAHGFWTNIMWLIFNNRHLKKWKILIRLHTRELDFVRGCNNNIVQLNTLLSGAQYLARSFGVFCVESCDFHLFAFFCFSTFVSVEFDLYESNLKVSLYVITICR